MRSTPMNWINIECFHASFDTTVHLTFFGESVLRAVLSPSIQIDFQMAGIRLLFNCRWIKHVITINQLLLLPKIHKNTSKCPIFKLTINSTHFHWLECLRSDFKCSLYCKSFVAFHWKFNNCIIKTSKIFENLRKSSWKFGGRKMHNHFPHLPQLIWSYYHHTARF